MIKVKHFLDRPRRDDGRRFWVAPLGVTRDLRNWCGIQGHLKELAPPRELWEWFREHPAEYRFYRTAYHAHLRAHACPATLRHVCHALDAGTITLLHDEDHPARNTAAALRDYLLILRAPPKDTRGTPLTAMYRELAGEAKQIATTREAPAAWSTRESDDSVAVEPARFACALRRGLAIYDSRDGDPVLLMPEPDGLASASAADGPLAALLRQAHHRVITFDPPGAFRSSRPMRPGLSEMLGGAGEALEEAGVVEPVDIVASGTACQIAVAFALSCPREVKRLILVGPLLDMGNERLHDALPWCWSRLNWRFWRFAMLSRRLAHGGGSLAAHKRLVNLVESASYFDPAYVRPLRARAADRNRPAPPRYEWEQSADQLEVGTRLGGIAAPTLVLVGRFDRRCPTSAAVEVALRLTEARLEIFEFSGHRPYVEERELFRRRVTAFLQKGLAALP